MKLILYPDPILETKCEPVEKITPELRQLAKDMYKFMKECNGIGLAANQIGRTERLIVVENKDKPEYLFNPQILLQSRFKYENEGCLSFPDKILRIKRPRQMVVQYLALNGSSRCRTFRGSVCKIISHEIDHLNGVLMIDQVNPSLSETKS